MVMFTPTGQVKEASWKRVSVQEEKLAEWRDRRGGEEGERLEEERRMEREEEEQVKTLAERKEELRRFV